MDEDDDVLIPNSDESPNRTRPSSPFPNDSIFSKKTDLLRSIAREIAEGLVPETILDSLEAVEKLDKAIAGDDSPVPAPATAALAYGAVALECTAKLLIGGGGKPGLKYKSAFDRIWRGRVSELERLGESGLVTSEVLELRDELEASFGDQNVRHKLLGMNTRSEAVSRVRVYLEEEGKRMGISFLECDGDFVDEEFRMVDSVKETSLKEFDEVSDREIIEENRYLVKNVKGLKSVEAKPSPSTLLGAEIIMSMSFDKTNRNDSVKNQSEIEVNEAEQPVHDRSDQLVKDSNVKIGKSSWDDRSKVPRGPRPSLMERNRSACTLEWDEPVHDLSNSTANRERNIYRHRRKTKEIDNPIKGSGALKNLGRRISRRWSLHEEDTLRIAVKRYGKQWKLILSMLGDEFDERTEVDLKDKWRNMIKYSQC